VTLVDFVQIELNFELMRNKKNKGRIEICPFECCCCY